MHNERKRFTKGALILWLGVLLALQSSSAFAGKVKLVSDTWDNICKVEVTHGMNAPKTSVKSYSNVKKNWSFTREDRVCYRRSRDPRRCDSGLTAWNCSSQLISGTDEFSLR